MSDIEKLKQFFYNKGEIRNYVLITLGLNTALRISDLLQIQWQDVWNFKLNKPKKHIIIVEQKTGKIANIYVNKECSACLFELKSFLNNNIRPTDYVFRSRNGQNNHIGRNRAYIIIKSACRRLGYEENLSCHSLRKTFGYHAWKQGISPAVLMSIYNHSSMEVTKRYLSIEQDDKDEVYRKNVL